LINCISKPQKINFSTKSNTIDTVDAIASIVSRQHVDTIPSPCPTPCPPAPTLARAELSEQQQVQQPQEGPEHGLDSIWNILDSGMRQGCRHGEQLDRIENELHDMKRRLRER
jgi:hypothetical protein